MKREIPDVLFLSGNMDKSKPQAPDSSSSSIELTLANLAGNRKNQTENDVQFCVSTESDQKNKCDVSKYKELEISPHEIAVSPRPNKFQNYQTKESSQFPGNLDVSQNLFQNEIDNVLPHEYRGNPQSVESRHQDSFDHLQDVPEFSQEIPTKRDTKKSFSASREEAAKEEGRNVPNPIFIKKSIDRQARENRKNQAITSSDDREDVSRKKLIPALTVSKFGWPSSVQEILTHNRPALSRWWNSVSSPIPQEQPHSVGILSCQPGPSTADLAMAFSQIVAQTGSAKQVSPPNSVLLDAQLENPSIGPRLELESKWSWSNDGKEEYDLNGCLIRGEKDDLDLLPVNCAIEDPNNDSVRSDFPCRYLLPNTYMDSLYERFRYVHDFVRNHYSQTVVNLGSMTFWDDAGKAVSLFRQFESLVLVDNAPRNERQISEAYWKLSDLGVGNIVILEIQ